MLPYATIYFSSTRCSRPLAQILLEHVAQSKLANGKPSYVIQADQSVNEVTCLPAQQIHPSQSFSSPLPSIIPSRRSQIRPYRERGHNLRPKLRPGLSP
jgi:hypothetical protein